MATSFGSFLGERIDTGTLPLAVGDVLVIVLVLTAGVMRHNGTAYPAQAPVDTLLTAVPFLLGWVVVAPLIGAYSAGAGESAKASVPLAVRSWVPAAVLGVLLRATPLFSGGTSGPAALAVFGAVIVVTGGVALAVWRWLLFKLL